MEKGHMVGIIFSLFPRDKINEVEEKVKFGIKQITDVEIASKLTQESAENIQNRFNDENLLFGVEIESKFVAFGWVAQKKAHFGKPEREINIPEGNYYLWDFATYPEYRGKNIYPNLLKAIIEKLKDSNHKFWILSHSENVSSLKGIEKVGFIKSGEVYMNNSSDLFLKKINERSEEAAQILNLSLLNQE